MKKNKTISIITAHYQDIDGIIRTWKSIKEQTFENWSWIIVDSWTENFKLLLPSDIISNNSIKIFQIKSSIYDAMNYGILQTETPFFHFLNCNSTYYSMDSLERVASILNYEEQFTNYIHTFEMMIINKNSSFIQSPSKVKYPYDCGHESTVFPSINKDKILIRSNQGLIADMLFMVEYNNIFKVKCYKFPFVNYPKGGYSDSLELNLNKIKGYNYIFLVFIFKGKISQAFFTFYRILSEIKEFARSNFKAK